MLTDTQRRAKVENGDEVKTTLTDHNRQVHATSANGKMEVVRYDREGRWYVEGEGGHRMRLVSVKAAVEAAMTMEDEGGQILLRQPGGKRFDSMVAAAKAKQARHR